MTKVSLGKTSPLKTKSIATGTDQNQFISIKCEGCY